MGLGFDDSLERPEPFHAYLRPLAIWLGIVSFFVGAITLGASLATQSGSVEAFTGPMLLLLGVSLIGGGFLMEPTAFFLDPDLEFAGREWYFLVAVSVAFLLFAASAAVLAVV